MAMMFNLAILAMIAIVIALLSLRRQRLVGIPAQRTSRRMMSAAIAALIVAELVIAYLIITTGHAA